MIDWLLFPPCKRVQLCYGQIGHTTGIQRDWKYQRDVHHPDGNGGPGDWTFLPPLKTEIDSQVNGVPALFGAVLNEILSVVPGKAAPEVVLR